MFEHIIPKKKVGFLAPRMVSDYGPYEFYQFAPPGLMMVTVPMGIRKFDEQDVARVYGNVDEHIGELVARRVDAIVQSGVPITALAGPDEHDRRLAYIEKKSGIQTSSAVLGAVKACRHLGVKKLAIADKFTTRINEMLARFFTREGIEVVGIVAWSKQQDEIDPLEVKRMTAQQLMDIGYRIGREALARYPEADGLYMPGGSWPLTPVVKDLEAETGKTVLGHKDLTIWQAARMVGMFAPRPGFGRLLSEA